MLRHIVTRLPLALAVALVACRNDGQDASGGGSRGAGAEGRPDAADTRTPEPAQQREPARAAPTEPPVARGAPPAERTSFTGTLRGDVAAIGGETTGWRLEGDAQTGGFEVDVSKVRQSAKALEGKRVTITGRLTTRGYPERGSVQILVADRIEEERPAPPGAR